MIQISHLKKQYGPISALDNLNMNVESGTVFGFLGPNGAGKTTTMRILAGLARADAGTANLAGINVHTQRTQLSQKIGYLPEDPAFYSWMTPFEFLTYLGRLHGLSSPERGKRINALLELVDLASVGKRRIKGFSRGMRQRLGFAAAIIHDPEVLLLDEPISALDPAGRKDMLARIESLQGRCTVLMSTHILADVDRVCDTIGIIAQGRMVVQEKRETLLSRYARPVFEIEAVNATNLELFESSIQSQPWSLSCERNANKLHILTHDASTARIHLLRLALEHQIPIIRFEEVKPSLEDIFLHLTNEVSQ